MLSENETVQVSLDALVERLLAALAERDQRIAALEQRVAKLENVAQSQQAAIRSMAALLVAREKLARQAAGLIESGRSLIDMPGPKLKI